MKTKQKERCRHERNSWIICGGWAEWCYVCGAYRGLNQVKGTNHCYPRTTWAKPTGDKNNNPYEKMKDLTPARPK